MMAACAANGPVDTSKAPLPGRVDDNPVASGDPGVVGPSATSAASAVLVAYQGYLTYSTLAAQTGDFDSQRLKTYAIDPLLGQWVVNVYDMYQRGVVQRGAVVHHGTKVTDVKLSTRDGVPIGTATIVDCLDNSGVSIIDAITRAVVVPATPNRFLRSVATAQMYPDRHWVISQVDAKAVTKC
jgi:hypothetical protein